VIRVLVVEDSPTTAELLVRLLEADGCFEVVGTAADGEQAVSLTARLRPHVITMDIHMPRLDGVAATRRIMAETPTPIVIVSASVQEKTVGLAFEAVQAGAVSVLDKPPGPGHPRHTAAVSELLTTVRLMADVKVVRRAADPALEGRDVARPLPPRPLLASGARPLAVGIAASTGGPHAIQTLLQGLRGDFVVPVLVVQHISRGFAAGMAAWLSSTCALSVKLAEHGETPMGGAVYLAPEDRHLVVTRRGTLVLSAAPPVQGFRPSANVLFESLADCYGAQAIGVVLTGMGEDGVAGLRMLHLAGAPVIAQDEATSVVYGMPGAAVASAAVDHVLPLPDIGPALRGLIGLNGQVLWESTGRRTPS
jgi:two-component system chemotaxis response regulator CheB